MRRIPQYKKSIIPLEKYQMFKALQIVTKEMLSQIMKRKKMQVELS